MPIEKCENVFLFLISWLHVSSIFNLIRFISRWISKVITRSILFLSFFNFYEQLLTFKDQLSIYNQ